MEGSRTSSGSAANHKHPRPTRTLVRGLSVLEVLAESPHGLGPTKLASLVKLDKGTVSRLLNTLVEAGYVRRDPASHTYSLSTKILRLSQAVGQYLDLRGIARPHLTRMCHEVNETVHLGVRDEAHAVYVDKVEPTSQPIRMVSDIGQAMPMHCTALGKAILSRYPVPVLDETLSVMSFTPQTSRTITDRDTLKRALAETRERGYAIDDRENMDNVVCVGAAIVGSDGHVVGAISISSPAFRVQDRIEEFGSRCRATAEAISREL